MPTYPTSRRAGSPVADTGKDQLISRKHEPSNPFSWNRVEVYASPQLLRDIALKIKDAYPSLPLTPREFLWELYREYGREGVFQAYALGFNRGVPYEIACVVSETKTEVPDGITPDQLRAMCFFRVRLDLPPTPGETDCQVRTEREAA